MRDIGLIVVQLVLAALLSVLLIGGLGPLVVAAYADLPGAEMSRFVPRIVAAGTVVFFLIVRLLWPKKAGRDAN